MMLAITITVDDQQNIFLNIDGECARIEALGLLEVGKYIINNMNIGTVNDTGDITYKPFTVLKGGKDV